MVVLNIMSETILICLFSFSSELLMILVVNTKIYLTHKQ